MWRVYNLRHTAVFTYSHANTPLGQSELSYFMKLQYKQPRQESGLCYFLFARYSQKCVSQIYRALYGDAMLVPIRMGTNMAAGNQQKHLSLSFAIKA